MSVPAIDGVVLWAKRNKRLVTAVALVTLPIWFLPFACILIFGGLYDSLHMAIWGRDE